MASTTVDVPGFRIGQRPNETSFSKEKRPAAANKGKPVGTLNKITRTMKDAAVAAAEELGHLPVSEWEAQLECGDQNGIKAYFKFLAVRHPKSFAIFLARIMPLHVTTSQKSTYVTRDQAIAELKEAGLPPDLIDYLRPVDLRTVDPDQVRKSPYDDPEVDDEGCGNAILYPTQFAAQHGDIEWMIGPGLALDSARFRVIPSLWGHMAGAGINPPDSEFLSAEIKILLAT